MLVYLTLAAGLAMLLAGGEWLVRGAVGLAARLAIPPVIIGLTVVAFGTSAPEMVISVDAALIGSEELAVGNVVGSNIANVLLVLGIPALLAPIRTPRRDVKATLFFLSAVTIVFMLMMWSGPIGWIDGLILLACLAAFLLLQYYKAKAAKNGTVSGQEEIEHAPSRGWVIAGLLLLGLILLPLGAHLTVTSAVDIAERWHISEAVIGLTIVAIGTSLPELATGIMAARSRSGSVAMGNIIGSNLFNIAAIMGVTTTIATIEAGTHIVAFDMWVMLAVTVFLVTLPVAGIAVGRKLGALLSLLYVCYLVATVLV